MIILREPAYAKVNLTLDVLGKREDGYHDLQSVFQGISMKDDIEIHIGTGEPWKLVCPGEGIPCDERNLAWKAAAVYCNAIGKNPGGLEIRIDKQLPSEAGLGGGSADAAAVLRALNRHFGEPMTLMELADLGAQVGSDVPFCVILGTAMAEGRGERLRKLPAMPDCWFVVVKPDFPVSTPALFRKIDSTVILKRPDNVALEQAIAEGDLNKIGTLLYNVFDPVVSETHPELDEIKGLFMANGALGCQMTGSGSACFAIARDEKTARQICDALKEKYPRTYLARPV